MQETALLEMVPLHLVEQRAQAHPQTLGRRPPIPAHRRESGADRLALGRIHGFPQSDVGRSDLTPWPPLRNAERGDAIHVAWLQNLLIREHRSPLDGMLELAHV